MSISRPQIGHLLACVFIVLSLAVMVNSPRALAATISQTIGSAYCASSWMGQTFVPDQSGDLNSIEVQFAFRGTGTGTARMRVYDTPNRTNLLATADNTVVDLSTGEFTTVTGVFQFANTTVSMVSGISYYFEVQNAENNNTFYLWSINGNRYSNGRLYEGSGACNGSSDWDAKFLITYAVVDTTAPTLLSSVPADNATGVSTSANIVLNFSENVTAVSAKNVVIKKSSDDSTVESISVTDGSKISVSGSQVTVNPSVTLDDLTGYYVTVDSGAFKDGANNVYAGISSSTVLNFTTAADTTAPALLSSVPADNATGVSTSASIVLNFSENVTAVSAKNIVIKKSSDDSTVETISVTDGSKISVSGSQVTVNPSVTLDDLTGYYVTVDSGAFKDGANNVYAGISASTALNFTTAAAITAPTTTAPPVTTVTNPAPTDTTVPTSTLSERTTRTTVVARVAPPVAAITTTTIAPTTTTSTTVADEDVPAPPAPDAAIGEAAALVNGEPVKLSISREGNILTVSGTGITMTVAAVLDDGTIAPLDTDGNVRLDSTRLLQLKLFGVALGSESEVWIYSTPVRLGVFSPDAEGSISARLVVPDEVQGGEHRFVVKTRAQSGDDETLALGIMVGAPSEGVQFEWLIGIPLSIAVVAALIIPATRRRRRAAAEV